MANERGMMDTAIEAAYTRVTEQGTEHAGEVDLNLAAHAWSAAENRKQVDRVVKELGEIKAVLRNGNGNGLRRRRDVVKQYGVQYGALAGGGGVVMGLLQLLQGG